MRQSSFSARMFSRVAFKWKMLKGKKVKYWTNKVAFKLLCQSWLSELCCTNVQETEKANNYYWQYFSPRLLFFSFWFVDWSKSFTMTPGNPRIHKSVNSSSAKANLMNFLFSRWLFILEVHFFRICLGFLRNLGKRRNIINDQLTNAFHLSNDFIYFVRPSHNTRSILYQVNCDCLKNDDFKKC